MPIKFITRRNSSDAESGAPTGGRFVDRRDAGRRLAALLARYRDARPIIFALPRGGVPVGYEVARALDAPLEVMPARKLGAPGHREYGIGAIAPGGAFVLNVEAVRGLRLPRAALEVVIAEETAELERRTRIYRGDRPFPDLTGYTAIVVDDGLATGMTALAAVRAVRRLNPARVVLAAPVCAPETAEELRPEVDDLLCVLQPEPFVAVGLWYQDFGQTSDDEVLDLIARAGDERAVAVAQGTR